MSKDEYLAMQETADIFSNEIDKRRLPTAMTLYRGQEVKGIMDELGCSDYASLSPEALEQALIGKHYRYRAFASTSVYPEIAEKFSDKMGFAGVFIEIEAPMGTRALHIGETSIWGKNVSKEQQEGEVTLQRDTEYEILGVYKDRKDEKYRMKLRIISQKDISVEKEEE